MVCARGGRAEAATWARRKSRRWRRGQSAARGIRCPGGLGCAGMQQLRCSAGVSRMRARPRRDMSLHCRTVVVSGARAAGARGHAGGMAATQPHGGLRGAWRPSAVTRRPVVCACAWCWRARGDRDDAHASAPLFTYLRPDSPRWPAPSSPYRCRVLSQAQLRLLLTHHLTPSLSQLPASPTHVLLISPCCTRQCVGPVRPNWTLPT